MVSRLVLSTGAGFLHHSIPLCLNFCFNRADLALGPSVYIFAFCCSLRWVTMVRDSHHMAQYRIRNGIFRRSASSTYKNPFPSQERGQILYVSLVHPRPTFPMHKENQGHPVRLLRVKFSLRIWRVSHHVRYKRKLSFLYPHMILLYKIPGGRQDLILFLWCLEFNPEPHTCRADVLPWGYTNP